MKRIISSLLVLLCFMVITKTSTGQLRDEFLLDAETASGVQQMFFRNRIVNAGGYTYTCGATLNDYGNYDILVSKVHSTADTLVWSVTYSGGYGGDDYAADVAVDGGGNVVVVGTTQVGSLDYDAITIKYNSSGTQQWVRTYAGAAGAPDGLTCVAFNGSDVYATGGMVNDPQRLTDVLIVKYNSSGTQQWAEDWDNSTYHFQDAAFKIKFKASNIIIYSVSQISLSPVQWKLAAIIYDMSSGSLQGSSVIAGNTSSFAAVRDIAMDDDDNIYVCGTKANSGQGKNIHVVKYDSTDLTEQWSFNKNGSANVDDEPAGIEIAGGYLLLAGTIETASEGKNIYGARLSLSSGTASWEINTDLAGGDDEATGLQTDSDDHLVIPCSVDRNGTKDIALVKLAHASGNTLSKAYYNGTDNRNDHARDISINPVTNDVYISAQVQVNDSTYESRIMKWRASKVYNPVPADGYSSYTGYIPNNFQLRQTDSTANRAVRFYSQANRVATYIDNAKISYQLLQANDTSNADTTYRVDMAFANGKGRTRVYPYNERKEYINYYLGHIDKPSVRTPLSNVVLRQEVYEHTDVLYTHSPSGFRHWFIARTGANPKDHYRLNFTGQTGLSIDGEGNLAIETTIGNIVYSKIKAYSMNTTTGVLTLLEWDIAYIIEDSLVRFDGFDEWSGVLVLEVDEKPETVAGVVPESNKNLDWSTFVGGSGGESHYGVDSDELGNVWYCGYTSGVINIAEPGQNIGEVLAHNDAFVVHFDWKCEAQWITVYGGNDHESALSIAIDTSGNSYCVGTTQSDNLPNNAALGVNDITLGGSSDGFFLKLLSTGSIDIDSYIGGDGEDNVYDVVYRPQNAFFQASVFIVGDCTDGNGFPTASSGNTLTGYDQAYAGGLDGFLMELSPEGGLRWSTFFGSSLEDRICGIADVGGYPTVIGYTEAYEYTEDECGVPADGKFPFCPNNWHQEEFNGRKCFIARFNKNRELIHSTFFGNSGTIGDYFSYAISRPDITTYRRPYGIGGKHIFYVSGRSSLGFSDNMHFNEWEGSGYPDPYYGDIDNYAGTINYRWFAKLYAEDEVTNFIGSSLLNLSNHNIQSFAIAADRYDGLIVTGGSTINALQDDNFCSNPDAGDFPLCDAGGQLYLEDNYTPYKTRCFMLHFDTQMNIVWSTQFGTGNLDGSYPNRNFCITSAGNYIFTGGWGYEYTPWDYDENSTEDYFRPVSSSIDAVATRFSLPQSVIVGNEEISRQESLGISIFPNPTLQYITVQLPEFALPDDVIEVYDTYGKLIHSTKTRKAGGTLTIDVGKLAAGMYIIKYTSSGKLLTKSFVKE